eukprot:scaffold7946_cov26-Tisochrysis_lutea.AAC.1
MENRVGKDCANALDAEEKRLGISRRTQEQALGGSKEELELECRQLNKQVRTFWINSFTS